MPPSIIIYPIVELVNELAAALHFRGVFEEDFAKILND